MKEIKALLADDEEQLRKYLKAKLAEVWPDLVICGEARNGRDALDLIAKHHPEIAFLDIRMPGLTGMEVARNARLQGLAGSFSLPLMMNMPWKPLRRGRLIIF